MELEVLVLEDTAGGRVTVGHAEQPMLFTAVATRQFCQESQLQDTTQTDHHLVSCKGQKVPGRGGITFLLQLEKP